jgi:hypothetical protein
MNNKVMVVLAAALMMLTASCRGGDDGGGSSCQSCLDDYCDCVDGESDSNVVIECGETAQSCAEKRCTGEEATNLDYSSCGGGGGDGDGSCQSCVDDYCTCTDGVTDNVVLSACTQAATECTAARCTPEETSALNFELCNAEVDNCQLCVDTTCDCIDISPGDPGMVDLCMETYQTCVEIACVGVDQSLIDTSCLTL